METDLRLAESDFNPAEQLFSFRNPRRSSRLRPKRIFIHELKKNNLWSSLNGELCLKMAVIPKWVRQQAPSSRWIKDESLLFNPILNTSLKSKSCVFVPILSNRTVSTNLQHTTGWRHTDLVVVVPTNSPPPKVPRVPSWYLWKTAKEHEANWRYLTLFRLLTKTNCNRHELTFRTKMDAWSVPRTASPPPLKRGADTPGARLNTEVRVHLSWSRRSPHISDWDFSSPCKLSPEKVASIA